ncbi:hypothetical protein [Moraxella porci]|uniref:hypothetical protein n=1 Tax=Moraxella porci TaxID=1288392 RepID=UPI002449D087|nr:hypothetical protein [Moraxella porci]MDH2274472.1 hypothetical protein [Moraxella porci]
MGLPQNLEAVGKTTAAAGVQTVATAGNILAGQSLAQIIQGAKAPAKMAKVIQDYPEVGAILDAYQKGEYHNLTLSQEALQALADATGISTEVLLTSITVQQGRQGATNKELTVIDIHDELRQDSIQTLAHELDHVRGGKSESLADLAGLAAKLNTEAAISANQDIINSIKTQMGDGTDALTTIQNQALLNQNNQTFTENHEGKEGEWDYAIMSLRYEYRRSDSGNYIQKENGEFVHVQNGLGQYEKIKTGEFYTEEDHLYNMYQYRVHEAYKNYLLKNNLSEDNLSKEYKEKLILDLMGVLNIPDSVFSVYSGRNYNVTESSNDENKTIVSAEFKNQSGNDYKNRFIIEIINNETILKSEYDQLYSNAYFFNRINNSLGYEKFKSNVIKMAGEYALPTVQIIGGGTQIIAATGIEVVGCGASYGTLCIPATALAALLAADGSDNIATGLYNLGEPPEKQTVSFTLTKVYGLSESDANTIKLIAAAGSMGGELGVAVNASRAANSAMTTSNLTQIKTAEPEQVIAIKIIDVENRLEDFKNIGSAYSKMPPHSTVNHTTDNMLVYNNANVDNPSFGIHATRNFTAELGKPVVHRAENINAGQATDRDGLVRVDKAKEFNDDQIANNLDLESRWQLSYHPTGYPAWKPGTLVTDRVLDKPERMRMVIDKEKYDQLMGLGEKYKKYTPEQRKQALGGWATQEPINSVADMRQRLAITEEFKPSVLDNGTPNQFYVVEFEVQAGVGVREGIAGTMFDSKTGQVMPGGVKQINFAKENAYTDPEKFIIDFDSIKEIK